MEAETGAEAVEAAAEEAAVEEAAAAAAAADAVAVEEEVRSHLDVPPYALY